VGHGLNVRERRELREETQSDRIVILSAAKNPFGAERSFASLRMTAWSPFNPFL
jgi:hypothetical protein